MSCWRWGLESVIKEGETFSVIATIFFSSESRNVMGIDGEGFVDGGFSPEWKCSKMESFSSWNSVLEMDAGFKGDVWRDQCGCFDALVV